MRIIGYTFIRAETLWKSQVWCPSYVGCLCIAPVEDEIWTMRVHYHIQWSTGPSLDWKAFPTREEASKTAESIKRRSESYFLVERDNGCDRCREFCATAFSAPNKRICFGE